MLAGALPAYRNHMRPRVRFAPARGFVAALMLSAVLPSSAAAAVRPHVIAFGRWTTQQWLPEAGDGKPRTLKVRALMVDGRVREYVLDSAHEVTDHLFVVRRAFRINDSLPNEKGNPRWRWGRGGWLVVDRIAGRISPLNLPEFDAYYSGELVSGLRGVLRGRGRWQGLRDGRATEPPQAGNEESFARGRCE